ncbi:MAG: hypothetical protein AAGU74_12860 [Bacillota bacterium]
MKKVSSWIGIKPVKLIMVVCFVAVEVLCVAYVARGYEAMAAFTESVWRLEPETPQDIDDSTFVDPPPSKVLPVEVVLDEGREIPLQFAYDDPEWERQAYKAYWHSSYGRWSYVPIRIHYALHRIFATYPTASIWYDFEHDLGIAEESEAFQMPAGNPFDTIVLVVMQTKVEKMITLGNQVVLVGRPSLTGLQVFLVPVKQIQPDNPQESILFQLVTEEGDEIDSTTLPYVSEAQSQTFGTLLESTLSRFFK